MAKESRPQKKTKIKKICICTSASFFKEALEIEKELRKLGFKVTMPYTALKMKHSGNFDISFYKTWFKNPDDYTKKAFLMKNHFNKIVRSDAVLVVNLRKNNTNGYIGGNGLMEMAIGFYFRKPIFILNKVSKDSPFYEETLGVKPTFLDGDLTKIK